MEQRYFAFLLEASECFAIDPAQVNKAVDPENSLADDPDAFYADVRWTWSQLSAAPLSPVHGKLSELQDVTAKLNADDVSQSSPEYELAVEKIKAMVADHEAQPAETMPMDMRDKPWPNSRNEEISEAAAAIERGDDPNQFTLEQRYFAFLYASSNKVGATPAELHAQIDPHNHHLEDMKDKAKVREQLSQARVKRQGSTRSSTDAAPRSSSQQFVLLLSILLAAVICTLTGP